MHPRPPLVRQQRRVLAWGLAAWLVGLAACRSHKAEVCPSVQALVMEELRMTDAFRDKIRDPHSMNRAAARLTVLSAKLRSLAIRDAELQRAVLLYGTHLGVLAEAYVRAARTQEHPEQSWSEEDDGHVGPGIPLSLYERDVNQARSAVTRQCSSP
ncbi:hypothetical protein [Myxococcus stipitatus]|uniref:hypothetical protein n=1 Tax=Myxococcus stipitatus TaxID=83455 RepID=UPI0002E54C55|nr:hypothetical protein [Myxococcus stipitatus]